MSFDIPAKKLIIIHGLNANQRTYSELISALKLKFDVTFYELPFHGSRKNELHLIDENLLVSEIKNLVQNNIDAHFLCHSFGALTFLIALSEVKGFQGKVILLAPAIFAKFNLGFTNYLPNKLIIPSVSPKKYREHSYIPLKIYNVIYKLQEKIHQKNLEKNNNIKVILDKNDELVHYEKTKAFLSSTYDVIDMPKRNNPVFYHIMNSKETLGEHWDWFLTQFEFYE